MSNQSKTVFLAVCISTLFLLIGNLLGGTQGMIMALIFALAGNLFSYWYSDKIVLKIYKAKEVSEDRFPALYRVVKKLTHKANMSFPKIYIIEQDVPNAFATGRNEENAVVAVTTGLIKHLNDLEIEGVLAHELAHIKNKDILIGTIIATFASAIMVLASMARWSTIFGGNRDDNNNSGSFLGVMFISLLAPVAATLIQMAVSRNREYLADKTGADIADSPIGLAEALNKLDNYSKSLKPINANPATAHMFIINPLAGKNFQKFFSTHPPTQERINRLMRRGVIHVEKKESKPNKINTAKEFWNAMKKK